MYGGTADGGDYAGVGRTNSGGENAERGRVLTAGSNNCISVHRTFLISDPIPAPLPPKAVPGLGFCALDGPPDWAPNVRRQFNLSRLVRLPCVAIGNAALLIRIDFCIDPGVGAVRVIARLNRLRKLASLTQAIAVLAVSIIKKFHGLISRRRNELRSIEMKPEEQILRKRLFRSIFVRWRLRPEILLVEPRRD